VLVGRDREVALLQELLAGSRQHRGGALVLAGEAGIGKTALVDHALASAAALGMQTRRITGVELHADLPYAGLTTLAGTWHDRLDSLPPTQAEAVRSALALADTPAHPLALSAGVLGLLCAASETSPLLLVVDDAQWLDRATLDALLFSAHRVEHDAVALLFAVRTDVSDPNGAADAPDTGRVPRVLVEGVDVLAAERILCANHAVARSVAEECWRATRGNPLALVELAEVLTPAQRVGREPLGDPLPVGLQLGTILRRRVDAMPPATRLALLVAAAEGAGDVGAIAHALASMQGELADFEPAERAGLVTIDAGTITWRHPLLRAAVYHAPSHPELRAVHRALASALDPVEHQERYAWHLALAAEGPDDVVAAHLAAVGERARRRGACFSAARAFERAARLATTTERRAAYLFESGYDLWMGGATEPTVACLSEVATLVEDPELRAMNATVLGQATLWVQGHRPATGLLESEARRAEATSPMRAVVLWCHLVNAHVFGLEMNRAVEAARRAIAVAEQAGPEAQIPAAVAAGLALLMHGDASEANAMLDPVEGLIVALADSDIPGIEDLTQVLGIANTARERWGAAELVIEKTAGRARRLGLNGALSFATAIRADLQWRTGRWAEAYAAMAEQRQMGEDAGNVEPLTMASAYLSRIEATIGLDEDCRRHALEAIDRAEPRGLHSLAAWARSALGLLALARDEPRQAVRWFDAIAESTARGGAGDPGTLWWQADWVEARWRLGDVAGAHRALARLETEAACSAGAWAAAAAARCKGLLVDDPRSFRELFEMARAGHEAIGAPFERARTELCYGERLLASGDDAEARRMLDHALDTFSQLGARDWSARVDRLTGGDAARTDPLQGLTASELRVAMAVGDGLSNRESAERLYVSVKTVDYHLQNIYRKLDVHSRSQLAALVTRRAAALASGNRESS
jgi:DNA-binding CsgD family transcriptional regulator